MRYTGVETPFAVGILPAAGSVTVHCAAQSTATLLTLSTDAATLLPIPADGNGLGVWQWSLGNILTPINGFAQLVVAFTHGTTGDRDYCKIAVRGVMDEIRKTRLLVSTLL